MMIFWIVMPYPIWELLFVNIFTLLVDIYISYTFRMVSSFGESWIVLLPIKHRYYVSQHLRYPYHPYNRPMSRNRRLSFVLGYTFIYKVRVRVRVKARFRKEMNSQLEVVGSPGDPSVPWKF